jgi:hypothetical protein
MNESLIERDIRHQGYIDLCRDIALVAAYDAIHEGHSMDLIRTALPRENEKGEEDEHFF